MVKQETSLLTAVLTQFVTDTMFVTRVDLDDEGQLTTPKLEAHNINQERKRFERNPAGINTVCWAGQDSTWDVLNKDKFADSPEAKLAVEAVLFGLRRHTRVSFVTGHKRAGKQETAIAAGHLAGKRRVLVLCATHRRDAWSYGIQKAVPGARVFTYFSESAALEVVALEAVRSPVYVVVAHDDGLTKVISERMEGFFDLLICDETEMYDEAASWSAAGVLGEKIPQVIGISNYSGGLDEDTGI